MPSQTSPRTSRPFGPWMHARIAPARCRPLSSRLLRAAIAALAVALLFAAQPSAALEKDGRCKAAHPQPVVPSDPALCASLAEQVRAPGALPLDRYEAVLNDFLGNWCHRDAGAGWVRDKRVRDTGPFIATRADGAGGAWSGQAHGTHGAVVIWYSKEMVDWLMISRPESGAAPAPAPEQPVPDGAMMIKEMYAAPASRCADVDPEHLVPESGAAVMVRANGAANDGWFWGWYGWGKDSGWSPDWPAARNNNRLPYMGFGQYCMNCHASARANLTFASLDNLQGFGGEPIAYLVQDWFERQRFDATAGRAHPSAPVPHHLALTDDSDDSLPLGAPRAAADAALADMLPGLATGRGGAALGAIALADIALPSQTYDNVWMPAGGPGLHAMYLTSDQCLGCHDAGGTGLQFDMTEPDPTSAKLLNLSPYATWRSSPMGLAGRDPVFFAQLASETQRFHPEQADLVQTTCLGCHGILGQRQWQIDQPKDAAGGCAVFDAGLVNARPYPDDNPTARHASYGALARDGISCMACHHMVLGEQATAQYAGEPQNDCVRERQALLNPDETGFAKTFTGSFLVGPPDELYGPFPGPLPKPMQHALGITPKHNDVIASSEVCGTCHTVHLPIFRRGELLGHTYEQTTYPEWAFSAYRTGESPDGPLPLGPGELAASCQDCHMPATAPDGRPYRSKIAGIQEKTSFPATDNTLPAADIDLPERDGFALHTLVGLNVFLVEMFQQFPDVLGMRTQDPMLVTKGVDPLQRTEQAMLDQASAATAKLAVLSTRLADGKLTAEVEVENLAGHKLPSGVGFRRAFIGFEVLDAAGTVLWASGRTNGAGVIVDTAGTPVTGELWWTDDCSARIAPERREHQPHYQVIDAEDQVQIYQELVSTPPAAGPASCGHAAAPAGELTTSFLSICAEVKDNRILPHGYLDLAARKAIAAALGAGPDLAEDAGSTGVGDDPDYRLGGLDALRYEVALDGLAGTPAGVRATLYFQAVPPFFLQDRFCTAEGTDTERLRYLTAKLNLAGTRAADWKLEVVSTGVVPLAGGQAAKGPAE